MRGYRDYMDRQQVSPALHDRILALETEAAAAPPARQRRHWAPLAAAAACLCLVLGVGWTLGTMRMGSSSAPDSSMSETASVTADSAEAVSEDAAEAVSEDAAEAAVQSEDVTADSYDSATTEDGAAYDSGAETAEDAAGSSAETEEAIAEDWPEEMLTPAWLPEGYSLTAFQELEEGRYLLSWTGEDGVELQMEYAAQAAEDCPWPALETLDGTEEAADTADGLQGFTVTDGSGWYCFTTTGDLDTLIQVAQSLS